MELVTLSCVHNRSLSSNILQTPFISDKDIVNGEKLVFEMGPDPNYDWK